MYIASYLSSESEYVYGVRVEPTWKFIWNGHLLAPVQHELHPDWVLYIVHGFIGQSSILYKPF